MEDPDVDFVEKPDLLQEKTIQAAYDFADVLRSDIDPMLDIHTRSKVCRTLTIAAAKLLESIGHKPVIKVKLNNDGTVYHYFLEDPDLGISIDFSPMSNRVGFKETGFDEPEYIRDLLMRSTLVLPLDSIEYEIMEGNGDTQIREKGMGPPTRGVKVASAYTWDHIHLEKMPDTIREKLEALK